jgi:hypothetical protein
MYFILNTAIAWYAQPDPSQYPKYMYVDYVRAYGWAPGDEEDK